MKAINFGVARFWVWIVFLGVVSSSPVWGQKIFQNQRTFSNAVRSMVVDPGGNLYIGSFGTGVWKIDPTGTMALLTSADGTQLSRRISKLLWHKDRLWAATAGEGVVQFDAAKKQWLPVEPPPGPAMVALHAFIFTSKGDLVIGSVGSGAAILSGGKWDFLGKEIGLADDWINDAAETEKGVWLAGLNGLSRFRSGKVDEYVVPVCHGASKVAWGDPAINVMLAHNGHLILGTMMDGVVRITPEKFERKYVGTDGDVQALVIWKNHLWAAGPGNLWRIPLDFADRKPKVTRITEYWETKCPFKALGISPQDTLLIGTMDGRIYETADGETFSLFAFFDNGVLVAAKNH